MDEDDESNELHSSPMKRFSAEKDGIRTLIMTDNNAHSSLLQSFQSFNPSREDLFLYIGTYYSPELETTYRVSLEDGRLTCHHSRHCDFEIKVIKKDVLAGELLSELQRRAEITLGK